MFNFAYGYQTVDFYIVAFHFYILCLLGAYLNIIQYACIALLLQLLATTTHGMGCFTITPLILLSHHLN